MTKRNYEVGDEVDLRVRIVAGDSGGFRCAVVHYSGSGHRWFFPEELDAGALVERPLKVGDLVTVVRA